MCVCVSEKFFSKKRFGDYYLTLRYFLRCVVSGSSIFCLSLGYFSPRKGGCMHQEFPDKNGSDWVSQVRQDLIACEIFHTEEEIKKMSKFKFKKLVNSRIKLNCRSYLTELQMKHSKTMYLHQESSMKEYLNSDQLK